MDPTETGRGSLGIRKAHYRSHWDIVITPTELNRVFAPSVITPHNVHTTENVTRQ